MKTEEHWLKLQAAFNPEDVLVGQRSNELYIRREHSPLEEMRIVFRRTALLGRPPKAFFTGHRGTGKSSMLFRLMEQLKEDYFIVYFDVEHNLDRNTANQIDILYLLGAAVFQVAARENIHPDPKNLQELDDSVRTITKEEKETRKESLNIIELTKNMICFGSSMLGAPLGDKLAEAALKPFNLTSGISEETARTRKIEPQVQEIINNINLIIADVETKADKPLLIVVDGLDKIQDHGQAELIFLKSRALLGPICRIIYTVPMLSFSSLRFAQMEEESKSFLLPNVKLYEKENDGTPYKNGYQTMHDLVEKRLSMAGFKLGDVFESSDVLELLILKSGGLMRWLIELVQNSFINAEIMKEEKVNETVAQKTIENRAARLASRLTVESVEELRKVRINKRPTDSLKSSELLHGLLIVVYRSEKIWYDVHPLLWEELEGE